MPNIDDIHRCIYEHGPVTIKQICEMLGYPYTPTLRNSIHSRIHKLVKQNYVEKFGKVDPNSHAHSETLYICKNRVIENEP